MAARDNNFRDFLYEAILVYYKNPNLTHYQGYKYDDFIFKWAIKTFPAPRNFRKKLQYDPADKEYQSDFVRELVLGVARKDEELVNYLKDENIPELPDKNQLIFVHCRSGVRSKQASQKLAAQGYTNIVEFGGILDWPGETVSE